MSLVILRRRNILLILTWLLVVTISHRQCHSNDIASMPPSYIRVNWGVVFNKVGTVLNGITKYRHTFAIPIPNMDYKSLDTISCQSSTQRTRHCAGINELTTVVNDGFRTEFTLMKETIANALSAIGNVEGRDAPTSRQRKKRSASSSHSAAPHLSPTYCNDSRVVGSSNGGGTLSKLGEVGSDMFGTPTWDDVKIVYRHICELANVVQINSQQLIQSNQRLSSISLTLNNQINALGKGLLNINTRINETDTVLQSLARSMKNDLNTIESKVASVEATQEAMYILLGNLEHFRMVANRYLEYSKDWVLGISRLLEGYIPQELIPISEIQKVLNHVSNKELPKHPMLRIVHPNPSFYYQVRSTAYTRSQDYLFITLTVPLKSVGGILGVYRVDRTYIATAEHHRSSTRIANLPQFFAVTPDSRYYTELSLEHYASCRGESIKVCPTERALQDKNHLTCAAAVFYDNKNGIVKHCDVRYEPTDQPTEVIRLRNTKYLVHSQNAGPDTTWSLHCPYRNAVPEKEGEEHLRTISSCNTCIVKVPCGCSLEGIGFYIPPELTGCDINDQLGFPDIIKAFPINLHVIASLYNVSDIMYLNGSSTHSDPSTSNPMMLSNLVFNLTESNWDDVVETDEKYNKNFKNLMDLHKKKSTIFADKATAIRKKLEDMNDLNMGRIEDIEDMFGGKSYKTFLNPSTFLTGATLSWCVAISVFIMSIYNCCRKR